MTIYDIPSYKKDIKKTLSSLNYLPLNINEARPKNQRHILLNAFGLSTLVLLMMISIAGASPFVYITTSNQVSVYDTATRHVTDMIPVGNGAAAVAVSTDGRHVYVVNQADGTISVINRGTNNDKVAATVHVEHTPYGVVVSPDGKKVYVTSIDGNIVTVIDTITNKAIDRLSVGNSPVGVAVSPDGKRVYVVNQVDDTVSIIDTTKNNTVLPPVSVGRLPVGVAASPDGKNVYVTNSDDGTVSIIDTTKNNTVLPPVTVGNYPQGIDVSPDGKYAYVTNQNDGTVSVIDTSTRNVICTVYVGGNPMGIAFTPDGKNVYVGNTNNNTSIIDTTTKAVSPITLNGTSAVFGKFIGPKGPRIVANFNWIASIGMRRSLVIFTDKSKGEITSWLWYFGTKPPKPQFNDPSYSTEQNPRHNYSAGNYTVKLTIKNAVGDNSTIAKVIHIETKPIYKN